MVVRSKKGSIPILKGVEPMLCTRFTKPVRDADYLNEFKWDSYRIIASKEGSAIRLDSTSGLDYTAKYPPVVEA